LSGTWLILFLLAAAPGQSQKTLPVTIEIVPKTSHSSGAALQDFIGAALVKRGWEVVGHNVEGPTGKVLKKAGIEVQDEAARIFLSSESAVRLAFEAKFIKSPAGKQALVLAASAYETQTSRTLGKDVVQSDLYDPANQQEKTAAWKLTCTALARVVSKQISDQLDVRPVAGKHYQVVFLNPPKNFDFKIQRKLKKLCAFSRAMISTKGFISFHTHCPLNRDKLAAEVKAATEKILGKVSCDLEKPETQYIVVVFKGTAP
jgi:16S rRNA G966 N2-methylase RsmD